MHATIAASLLLTSILFNETDSRCVLKRSEVVFMYAASDEAYKVYQASFVAWGGANTKDEVERHHALGVRCTGSMWCLTPGAELIHKDPEIRNACAVDIEGKPIEVPWLFDHTYEGTPSYFGCTNHPVFQALCQERVRNAMAGGADGLHVDDHLGVASPAWWHGGGFCEHCMAGFRDYLKEHASKEQLKEARIEDLEDFDYRELVRKVAPTREDYKKRQNEIPLYDLFKRFHVEAAAEHTRRLGELASEVAGRPVLLSANAGIPSEAHTYVLKYLTHVVCEVGQNAASGTRSLDHALQAYELASNAGKPLAATASGWDWAFVYDHHCEELVRFWIALAYSQGQRFMVPHPKKQWCFNNERGTHWYEAPIEAYAPMYRFIRNHPELFDGLEANENCEMESPEDVFVALRCPPKGQPSSDAFPQAVLHCLNRDYDSEAQKMNPQKDATVLLRSSWIPASIKEVKVYAYDADPYCVPIQAEDGSIRITLPTLRLWSLVAIPADAK